jgi:hypothetical protein
VSKLPRWLVALVVVAFLAIGAFALWQASANRTPETAGSWSAPKPPDEFASGLTIGFIPDGFSFVWSEGHETATFHVFMTADDSEQVSVGRQIDPEPYPLAGESVTRAGRDFTVVEATRETRILEDVGNGIRVEVVSASLDSETLLAVAESVTYDPAQDR